MPNKDNKPIPSDLPAGHKRDELDRRITDALAQKAEEEAADPEGIQAVDPSKLHHIDNEIGGPYMEQRKRERESGLAAISLNADDLNRAGVSNPVPGYHYKWLSNEDFRSTPEGKAAVRAQLAEAAKWHFFPVTDAHDPDVAKEFKGGEGSLRRWGDVVLWAIYHDDYLKVQEHAAAMMRRQGMVEEDYVNTGTNMLRGKGTAYDINNPRFARYMGQEKTKPFTAKVVTEGENPGTTNIEREGR